jgi:hypothetical protein
MVPAILMLPRQGRFEVPAVERHAEADCELAGDEGPAGAPRRPAGGGVTMEGGFSPAPGIELSRQPEAEGGAGGIARFAQPENRGLSLSGNQPGLGKSKSPQQEFVFLQR